MKENVSTTQPIKMKLTVLERLVLAIGWVLVVMSGMVAVFYSIQFVIYVIMVLIDGQRSWTTRDTRAVGGEFREIKYLLFNLLDFA